MLLASPWTRALDQTLTVDQLSTIHFGKEPAGKWLPYRVTLQPAQWIWLPSERTLPNTFVLFRKEFTLPAQPARATGWLTADSRYRLTVNGQRVQWGPARAILDNWMSIHWTSRHCCERERMSWRSRFSITESVKVRGRPESRVCCSMPSSRHRRAIPCGSFRIIPGNARSTGASAGPAETLVLASCRRNSTHVSILRTGIHPSSHRTSVGWQPCCCRARPTNHRPAVPTSRLIRSTRRHRL